MRVDKHGELKKQLKSSLMKKIDSLVSIEDDFNVKIMSFEMRFRSRKIVMFLSLKVEETGNKIFIELIKDEQRNWVILNPTHSN